MKGIEKLKNAELYDITTEYGQLYKQLCFEYFERENDDVTVAVFSDPVHGRWYYFDISVPNTVSNSF